MARPRSGLVFVHPSDELYGADRMLLSMLAALPEGVDAEVWLPRDLGHPGIPLCVELEARGHRYRHVDMPILRRSYQTPAGIVRLGRRVLALRRELRDAAPERVYCTTSAASLAAPVARLTGVPNVLGHVQELWGRTDRLMLSGPLFCAHSRLAISEAVRAALPDRLARSTTVVPNGTRPPPDVTTLTGRTGPLTYVVASRWNGWKGHQTLLRAWDLAGGPGRLVVLGGPPLSGEWADVPGMVASLRHGTTVDVVGEVKDPFPYLDRADVVLVPSERPEPFGLVAIEAFARGRPVIATDAGGLREIVTHGSDGWLFPPGDAGRLAALFSQLTRSDVEKGGQQARDTFEERFTEARWAADWTRAVFGRTVLTPAPVRTSGPESPPSPPSDSC